MVLLSTVVSQFLSELEGSNGLPSMSRFFGTSRRNGKERELIQANEAVIGPSDVSPSTPAASDPGDDDKIHGDRLNAILDDRGKS